jgi:hypothetical protein
MSKNSFPIAINTQLSVLSKNTKTVVTQSGVTFNKPLVSLFSGIFTKASTLISIPPIADDGKNKITLNVQQLSAVAKPNDTAVLSTKTFTGYEIDKGLTSKRPEMLSIIDYESLRKDNADTVAGSYHKTVQSIKKIRHSATNNLLKSVNDKFVTVKDAIKLQDAAFSSAINKSANLIQVVHGLVYAKNLVDDSIDLKSHTVDSQAAVRQYVSKEIMQNQRPPYPDVVNGGNLISSRAKTPQDAYNLSEYMLAFLPKTYDYQQLLSQFGFSTNNIRLFMSTKLWTQTIYELKETLLTHSVNFVDGDTSTQMYDTNPTTITTSTSPRFVLSNVHSSLPKIENIRLWKTNVDAYNGTTYVIKSMIGLYENFSFSSENLKIAVLCNALSKEYRLSKGLTDSTVISTLKDDYGYTVNDVGNLTIFDYILGKFGRTCFDVQNDVQNSLVNLSQTKANQYDVLNFESEYVSTSNGALTPSSAYFTQDVITSSDITKLSALNTRIKKSLKSFYTVVDKLNLLDYDSNNAVTTQSEADNDVYVQNPYTLYHKIYMTFISVGTLKLQFSNGDIALGLLSLAAEDVQLRASLLLYFVKVNFTSEPGTLNISLGRTPDPTVEVFNYASTKSIINDIVNRFNQLMIERSTSRAYTGYSGYSKVTYTRASIENALKSKTGGFKVVSDLFHDILTKFMFDLFTKNHAPLQNGITRFSGVSDTALSILTLDTIIHIVKRVCGHVFVSAVRQKNSDYSYELMVLKLTPAYQRDVQQSFSDTVSRLKSENARVQMSCYALMSTMSTITNNIDYFVGSLNSKNNIDSMKQIRSIIGDADTNSLFKQTQALMLASHVDDTLKSLNNVSNEFQLDMQVRLHNDLSNVLLDLSDAEDFPEGSKILTVGLPTGFTEALWSTPSIDKLKKTTYNRKERDVISLTVYMTDTVNPDIIFKPVRFLFELTRFPVRYDYVIDVPSKLSNPRTYYNLIKHREGSSTFYFEGNDTNDVTTFSSSKYSFLNSDQKQQIYKNHSLSYLLEHYINTMTGVRLDEISFSDVKTVIEKGVDSAYKSAIFNNNVEKMTTPVTAVTSKTGVLFNIAPTQSKTVTQTNAKVTDLSKVNVDSLSLKFLQSFFDDYTLYGATTNVFNRFTDQNSTLQYLLSPRTFDRVFNVLVNKTMFTVDVQQTTDTVYGKKEYDDSLKNNTLIVDQNGNVKINDSIDARLYKYFTTIETFDEAVT